MPYKKAVSVKPMKNFIIIVKFEDGERRLFNCSLLSKYKLYDEIFDTEYFKKVHVDDMGLVCWDNATDIEPDFLWDNSEDIENFQTAV